MSTSTPSRVAASAAGHVLGATAGVVARIRSDRPLHPRGVSHAAVVTTTGAASTGVPWLDEPGVHDCTLRVSRAAGLPPWLPDVHGLALRLPTGVVGDAGGAGDAGAAPGRRGAGDSTAPGDGGGVADLLFAGTGQSAAGRFVLRPRWRLGRGALTTLLPVRSPAGPLLLRLTPAGPAPVPEDSPPDRMVLSWAVGTGPWRYAGEVVTGAPLRPAADRERHDPVVHQLPGTEQYPVVRRLREPAYRRARRQRPGR